MTHQNPISDELINSYVDGELSHDERSALLEQANSDNELAASMCKTRQLKELVANAYENPPKPKERRSTPRRGINRRMLNGIAAASLLAVGITAGWFAQLNLGPAPSLTVAEVASPNLILHLSSDDPVRVSNAVTQVENYIRANANQNVQMEIVARGDGLKLLSRDTTELSRSIISLADRFGNVKLVACNRAIERAREKGRVVNLYPGVKTVPAAIDAIVKRVQDGWHYIQT